MDFNLISQPYFQKLVQAVCLTLLHSVWQGMVAAIMAGAVLLLTGKQKPALRYNLLCGVLLLFVGASGLTFYLEMQTENSVFTSVWTERNNAGTSLAVVPAAGEPAGGPIKWVDFITGFCDRNAEIIVAVWFLIFGFKSVQAVSGIVYLRKIRRRNICEPAVEWKLRFKELAGKLGINSQIALLESEQITVPMVMGFFKPIVLIPLGMLSSLPAAQVEAILLHELAHIRRRDYLVNLMQILCENVFFFHPAVIWISFLVKEEREHCCDDLAISVMQNKTSFIHALVSFQEYNQSAPAFGMAFSKKRNHLLDRIKRIINNNNKSLDAMEKLFVTVSLVAVAALSAAVSQVNPGKDHPILAKTKVLPGISIVSEPTARIMSEPALKIVSMADTLPGKKKEGLTQIHSANVYSAEEGVSTYDVSVNGKKYNIIQQNGKVTKLAIDGKEIPESQIASYKTEIDDIVTEIKVAHERAEVDRQKAEGQRAEANVLRQQAEATRQQAGQYRVQADQQRELAGKQREEAEKYRTEADKMRVVADRQREQAEKYRQEADVSRKQAEEMRYTAEKDREEYQKMQDGMIDDLIGAGVIKGVSGLSYKLSQDELIVNGVKQPADLHQKLKAKYIRDKAVEMVYNFKGRTGYTVTGFIYTR